jgi:peroxiredoxin
MIHGTGPGKSWKVLIAVATASLLLVVAIPFISHFYASSLHAAVYGADREIAPDFGLKDIDGSTVHLSQFRGRRPVLLYFWATWCPYCIAAKPKVAKLRDQISSKDLEILSINVSDTLEKLKRYQDAHPVKYGVLYDGDGRVAKSYQVRGIPLFVLVDKDGAIVYRGDRVPDPAHYLK